jgi:hypothetical protein
MSTLVGWCGVGVMLSVESRFLDDDRMGMYVVLVRSAQVVTGLPDPNGGHFDAAGDFDRILPAGDERFVLLGRVDPYGDTVLRPEDMSGLIDEVDKLIDVSHQGSERRGLRRLRVLAAECRDTSDSQLRFVGD